jgi:hypothetical protein
MWSINVLLFVWEICVNTFCWLALALIELFRFWVAYWYFTRPQLVSTATFLWIRIALLTPPPQTLRFSLHRLRDFNLRRLLPAAAETPVLSELFELSLLLGLLVPTVVHWPLVAADWFLFLVTLTTLLIDFFKIF